MIAIEHSFKRSVKAVFEKPYDVHILSGFQDGVPQALLEKIQNRSCCLITTPTVASLYGEKLFQNLTEQGVINKLLVLDCREGNKSFRHIEKIASTYFEHQLGRDSILIGLGGGVCTDLVTMAASLIRRGIETIRIPTTLIGQVDASIGIKGAINFAGRKSGLGCYYPPSAVFIDPFFLSSLKSDQIRDGLAEIIKMAMVRDRHLLDLLSQHADVLDTSFFKQPSEARTTVLKRAVFRMLEELESNLYEDQTYQRLVDFGHFLSPKIETASGYQLSHGQAVAIDMVYSCAIGCHLGMTEDTTFEALYSLLKTIGLPVDSELVCPEMIQQSIFESELHRAGHVNWVVPHRVGEAYFIQEAEVMSPEVIQSALEKVRALSRQKPMTERKRIVMDIGGTHLRVGIFNDGQIENLKTVRTPSFETFPGATHEQILNRLLEQLQLLVHQLTQEAPRSISVSFAGPLDANQHVLAAPTIWGDALQAPLDLQGRLQMRWPESKIHVLNDVSAAGYRYLNRANDFCIITVSSGIGNKIFVDGKPQTGPNGRGGEIGHLRVDFDANGPLCDCGGMGHLGAIASGRGTLNAARICAYEKPVAFSQSFLGELCQGSPDQMTNQKLARAFHADDPWTHSVVGRCAQPLGQAIASIHLNLGCEKFIIIGGFARALGESYRQILVQAASDVVWLECHWDDWICLGEPDDECGLIGAGIASTLQESYS